MNQDLEKKVTGTKEPQTEEFRPVSKEDLRKYSQPDVLAPEQYLETFRRKTYLEPEKNLMLAVLEDALKCYTNNVFARSRNLMRSHKNAEEWILGRADWLFSFENVCETLEIGPGYLKEKLISWKTKKLEEIKKQVDKTGNYIEGTITTQTSPPSSPQYKQSA